MPILIDGNNLLYAALEHEPERPPSRSTLCTILGQWARLSGEKVAIIFDGAAPTAARAEQISDPDVDVRYSGVGIIADEVIENVVNADSAARLLTVVSTDREVARSARRRRASTERSDVFWAKVLRELDRAPSVNKEPEEKRSGLAPQDVETWLRELELGEK